MGLSIDQLQSKNFCRAPIFCTIKHQFTIHKPTARLKYSIDHWTVGW
uniref:Uncharacterized protein n=1 Tax=Romanomermis culicivorax TaxID=13658 RepID=A0A915KF85_ROMCU